MNAFPLQILDPCLLAFAAGISSEAQVASVRFGAGANQFTMDFVTIGKPGNAPDPVGRPQPAGVVAYPYRMAFYFLPSEHGDDRTLPEHPGLTPRGRGTRGANPDVALREGGIVLLPLAQADGTVRPGPAVALRQHPGFNDWLVCAISTQLLQAVAGFDETIETTGGRRWAQISRNDPGGLW